MVLRPDLCPQGNQSKKPVGLGSDPAGGGEGALHASSWKGAPRAARAHARWASSGRPFPTRRRGPRAVVRSAPGPRRHGATMPQAAHSRAREDSLRSQRRLGAWSRGAWPMGSADAWPRDRRRKPALPLSALELLPARLQAASSAPRGSSRESSPTSGSPSVRHVGRCPAKRL